MQNESKCKPHLLLSLQDEFDGFTPGEVEECVSWLSQHDAEVQQLEHELELSR